MHEHLPYYGKKISRAQQQEYIRHILSKYRKDPPNEDLQKKIHDDLMQEKDLGHVTIPFRVLLEKDETGARPAYIEIILDSKV